MTSLAQLGSEAAWLLVWLALPVLAGAALGGLVASLLGVVTTLQDQAITLLARLCGASLAIVIFVETGAHRIVAFAKTVFAALGAA